jgi:hypothetical protein
MPIFVTLPFLSYRAMAVYPFIFVQSADVSDEQVVVNHELIHHRQQLELLILPFYMLYAGQYLSGLLRYRDHDRAYRNIILEREAYAEEGSSLVGCELISYTTDAVKVLRIAGVFFKVFAE